VLGDRTEAERAAEAEAALTASAAAVAARQTRAAIPVRLKHRDFCLCARPCTCSRAVSFFDSVLGVNADNSDIQTTLGLSPMVQQVAVISDPSM